VTVLAGIDYGCAQFITPLIGIEATTINVLAVYAVVLATHGLINHFGIRLVAWLNDLSVTIHIVGVIAIVGALFLFAPKHPMSFFLKTVTHNAAGWPYWWAFIIGLLQAQWTFTGYDASASVSEETVDPRRRVPWGMVMAVVVSSVVGYLLLIGLTLAIDDIITILQTALGSTAGTLFSALAVMAMWFCGLSAVTWSSRVIYAFSRDGGLPASHIFRRVSRKHQTPGPAIWLCIVTAFIAALYSGAYSVFLYNPHLFGIASSACWVSQVCKGAMASGSS
jgi:amino acid transporter